MGAVVVDLSMSLDGFVTGPNPRAGLPLGEGGERLHEWMFGGRAGSDQASGEGAASDVNGAMVRELFATTGAVLMGRRIFDMGLEPWGDTPFPVPCFVLTHQAHEDVVMASGTFTFITDGLAAALDRARAAAAGKNVLAHSPDIAQQLLRADLLDEISLHLAPVLLGGGRRLFEHLGEGRRDLQLAGVTQAPGVTHLRYHLASRRAADV